MPSANPWENIDDTTPRKRRRTKAIRPWSCLVVFPVFGLAGLFAVLLFFFRPALFQSRPSAVKAEPDRPRSFRAYSAQRLFEFGFRNPDRADDELKGKVLEVNGKVSWDGADGRGRCLVFDHELPPENMGGSENIEDAYYRISLAAIRATAAKGVRCYIPTDEKPFAPGDTVTLQGTCKNVPGGVELVDCRVLQRSPPKPPAKKLKKK